MMKNLPRRQLALLGVCAVALAIGFANAVHGESTAAPVVVVGLAKCSDCTRKSMNTEAAFRGLKVAVKCKNAKGEYESKAVGQVDKSGAFSVPLASDLVGDDGELKQDCFAQLHSASSVPCPGQEPSKIVAAQPSHGDGKATFDALAGKMHQPSEECASAFLCNPVHKHHPVVFHKPVIVPPKHDDHDNDHDHFLPPVNKPPSAPIYVPKPSPIYHPPTQRNTVTDPQLFKKLLPFLKKHDHDHHHDHNHDDDHGHDHFLPPASKPPSAPVYVPKSSPIYHPPAQRNVITNTQLFKKLLPFFKKHDHDHHHDHDHILPPVGKPSSTPVYVPKPTPIYHPPAQHNVITNPQQFKKLLPFFKNHDHHHDHDHILPPVGKPSSTPVYVPKPTPIYHPPTKSNTVTDPQQFKKLLPFFKNHDHGHDHDHDHFLPSVGKPPLPPVYVPKPTPIYHPPTKDNAATDPQQFKKLLPFFKNHDHHHDHDHGHDHFLPSVGKPPSAPVYVPKPTPIYHPPARDNTVTDPQQFKKLLPFFKNHDHYHDHDHDHDHFLPSVGKPPSTPVYGSKPTPIYHPPAQRNAVIDP